MRSLRNITLAVLLLTVCGIWAAANAGPGRNSDTIVGSGKPATAIRTVPAFRAIALTGPIDLEFRTGPTQRVELTADDNLLPLVTTTVRDGALTIALTAKSISTRNPLHAVVIAPNLGALSLRGSGNAILQALSARSFALSLEGSGDIHASGTTATLGISLSGSGNIDAKALRAETAAIDLSGSGNIILHASQTLAATLNGSGNITVHGHPTSIVRDIHGSGTIHIEP